MPPANRSQLQDIPALPPSAPALSLPPIEFDPAIIRGLPNWETGTLMDGRVVLVVTLDVPGQAPETRQILLHRTTAAELGAALQDLATALHYEQ